MGIFEGTPREKFYEIMLNAEGDLVKQEIEKMLSRLVALEELSEKKGISEGEIYTYMLENSDEIEMGLNDKFIEFAYNIVSQNG